jgi:uncharacterized membrane protein (UPF0182 family)
MKQDRDRFKAIALALLVIFILSLSGIVRLITDYWWFDALGASQIFMISLKAKILLFILSASFFLAFAMINLRISSKSNESKFSFKRKFMVVLAISFFIGLASSGKWFVVLQYLNQVPFNIADPIFAKDVSFYVFSLPFILSVKNFLMACVIITALLVLVDYLQSFIVRFFKQPEIIAPDGTTYSADFKLAISNMGQKALVHIAVLGSFFFVLLAAGHYLARFGVMYSEKGIVVGAGYADVAAYLPVIQVLMIMAIIIALLCYVWMFTTIRKQSQGKWNILASVIVLYLLVSIIAPAVIPGIVQAFKVSPNEEKLEQPYIESNIKFTKIAYGLTEVAEKDFSVEMMTPEIISNATDTLDNIRILDWRPLTQTYKQTQEMRLYYDLSGIDIDRYEINGSYTEVMIAPREMNQERLQAKTWVNLHPQIYYGEMDNDFVIVNTRTSEFDYPMGDANEYIQYDGSGGVKLDSSAKELLMAMRFADIKIMLSGEITPESRILFDRDIRERISKIAPFLTLDKDPYLVISEGRLFWMLDAYTVTDKFPYSEKHGSINYMRNSVKIVVDAYNGDVAYYIVDNADPVIATYAKIFPGYFKSFDLMPDGLKKHVRYPEGLFEVQSAIYNTYHMDNVKVFYNKEDAWQIPNEVYGTGQKVPVDPYYIIIKLPGAAKEEFVLMRSVTPIKKDNMVAWLAARSDGDHYGELLLYKFPKEKLVYGPLQIEAKFDQDAVISQQLTLWSLQGSSVTRGNLLVIPLLGSILYIEPLYIKAEAGQIPELKRVLVSDGERVVMEKDLASALVALFGETRPGTVEAGAAEEGEKSTEELITEAQMHYDAILDSMGTNWTAFGEHFDKLGKVLGELGSD